MFTSKKNNTLHFQKLVYTTAINKEKESKMTSIRYKVWQKQDTVFHDRYLSRR